jgi:hypothetical protein
MPYPPVVLTLTLPFRVITDPRSGARVGRSDKGWETSVTAIDLTKRGQEIFGKSALVSISFTLYIFVITGFSNLGYGFGYTLSTIG